MVRRVDLVAVIDPEHIGGDRRVVRHEARKPRSPSLKTPDRLMADHARSKPATSSFVTVVPSVDRGHGARDQRPVRGERHDTRIVDTGQ